MITTTQEQIYKVSKRIQKAARRIERGKDVKTEQAKIERLSKILEELKTHANSK